MKKILFIFILGFLLPFALSAQSTQAEIDTLLLELSMETADTERVEIMGVLASSYRFVNLEEAEKYINKATELAQEINYSSGELRCLFMAGVIYRLKGDVDQAINFGKASLDLAIEKENWFMAGANGNSLGNAYGNLGMYDTAMVYFFQALEAYEKADLPVKSAMIYNNLGDTFYKQNKTDIGKEYLIKALDIYKTSGKMKLAAMTLMNLGRKEENDSLALSFLGQSMEIHTQNNDLEGIASVKMNIGSRLIDKKQYEAALSYYLEALEQIKKVGHKRKTAIASNALGNIYTELNQTEKAISYFETALSISKNTKSKKEKKDTYNNLSKLYTDQKDFEKALKYLKLSKDLSDSLINEKTLSITSDLEAKYDSQKKEAALASQQLQIERQKNFRNRILIGGVLLILGIIAIFQRYYYHQKRKRQEALILLEQQKSEAESLRQLDQLKTKFFGNISHELRTPLTLIISPLENALHKLSKKAVDEDLNLAYLNSKKLLKLVNEILDLTKLEAGQLELHESAVSLDQLSRRIFFSFQSLAQIRNINLQFENELPKARGIKLDIEKFERILNNLLSNAIKFSNSGDHVLLKISSQQTNSGEHLIFKVIDSGLGIPAKDLDKIFDRYFQSKSGKMIGGTGIGLALSKELALLFGGDLTASSKEKEGSVFTLQIPYKKAEITQSLSEDFETTENELYDTNTDSEPISNYKPILLNGQKPRILIVEDNLEMSTFLEKILSPFYDCHKAFNGKDALLKLGEAQFDLITSDVMMPEMDGFEFRETINKNKQWKQMPFILLTARTIEEDKLRGFHLGIDDYITKPFSARELLARIANLLSNKSERDQFQKENNEPEQVESVDHQLLKKAEQVVLDHLSDSDFKVTSLAKEIGYSQRQLSRIINKLTGLSTVNFILEIRLQKAYQLLQNRQFATVSEVRYEVGIESASYFTAKFKERFGKKPTAFLRI